MSAPQFPPGIGEPEATETPENGHVTPSENSGGSSHLEWLRERHEAITAERHLDREVPGYDGRLVLRFEPVPWRLTGRLQKLLSADDPDGRALLLANADMLIAACKEVLVRVGDQLVSVDPSGEPVRIEPRLAELLKLDTRSARDTLLWLFGNEFAVSTMSGEVMEWTRDASAASTDDLLGESAPVVK